MLAGKDQQKFRA